MLLHQLLAIIVYSGWHYGRVFHDNQQGEANIKQASIRVSFILLMSYLLYTKTLLFFAITLSKAIYNISVLFLSSAPVLINPNNKWDIGLVCCIVYIVG